MFGLQIFKWNLTEKITDFPTFIYPWEHLHSWRFGCLSSGQTWRRCSQKALQDTSAKEGPPSQQSWTSAEALVFDSCLGYSFSCATARPVPGHGCQWSAPIAWQVTSWPDLWPYPYGLALQSLGYFWPWLSSLDLSTEFGWHSNEVFSGKPKLTGVQRRRREMGSLPMAIIFSFIRKKSHRLV